jgi:maltoporin
MQKKRLRMLPLTAAVLLAWAGAASALEFHGYFRSGIGASSKDGGQECFKLAGVEGNGNFRLGNECETYGEAELDQNVYDGKDGVKFDYHVMFGYATTQEGDFENLASPSNHIALRQNYVDAKNLPFLNGGAVWAGKRYYQRHDIHVNDFFYWNNSGPGAGVEKIGLGGTMNTSFAVLRNNGNNTTNDPNANAATTLDWRLAGIPLGGLGSLEVGLQYNKEDTKLPNSKNGTALLAEWSWNVLGGVNKVFGMYGTDSAAHAGIRAPSNQLSCDFNQTVGSCDEGYGLLDSFQFQINPAFSGMAAIGYYDFKNNYKWTFAGIRPVWHVTDYFKLQGELAYNKVKAASQADSADLTHFVIAPTIVAGRGFWARPELRLFYAYNKWNNKARDGVFGAGAGTIAGGTTGPFGASTNGATWGIQAEAWW